MAAHGRAPWLGCLGGPCSVLGAKGRDPASLGRDEGNELHLCFPETHPVFHPSLSSTYSEVGNPFSIQYGTGSLTGIIGADQVSVSVTAYLFSLGQELRGQNIVQRSEGAVSDLPQEAVGREEGVEVLGEGASNNPPSNMAAGVLSAQHAWP